MRSRTRTRIPFLVAKKRLYISLSVRPSVRNAFFGTSELKATSNLTSINAPAQRSPLTCRVYKLVEFVLVKVELKIVANLH